MKISLRASLLLSIVVIALPVTAAMMWMLGSWSLSEVRNAQSSTLSIAREITITLESELSESRRVLQSIAENRVLNWNDPQQLDGFLSPYLTLFPFSTGVFLFDLQGNMLAPFESAAISSNVSDRQWFQKTITDRKFTIGEFVLGRLTGTPIIPLGYPVFLDGKLSCVLVLSVNLEWIYEGMETRGASDGSSIILLADDGTVLVRYPFPENYIGNQYPGSELNKVLDIRESETMEFRGADNIRKLYSVSPVVLDGEYLATLLVGIPTTIIQQRTQTAGILSWAIIIFSVLAVFAFFFFGMRIIILNPVSRLASYTESIGKGQFDSQINLSVLPSELKHLAEGFNTMAGDLEKRDREISRYQNHLEDIVKERTGELERSNSELQQFAYVASHDLQEPLRMVASFTQLLEKKYGGLLDEQAGKYIRYAVDGATRMQILINDLLEFSRVETRPRDLKPVESNVSLNRALHNLSILIGDRKAVVEIGQTQPVIGDEGQLTQVFQNLISNGIKFNRSLKPYISVKSRQVDDMVEFCVEDNGIGIDQEFNERIFVIFQRLNLRDEFEGTGIGLAMCKRIVEKHGGTIWHEPAPRSGSRFYFTLKAAGTATEI